MSTEAPTIDQLLAVAVEAARAAGAVLIEGLGRDIEVQQKSERANIVTWADFTAQERIVEVLTGHYPDHAIMGEEGNAGASFDTAPVTWIVDPLDGTSNYASGIPFACSSVGAVDREGLVVGAVFNPFSGELYTATRGGGAWLGDQRLQVKNTADLNRAVICTGVQSDDPDILEAFGRRMTRLFTHCRGVRMLGCPAMTLCYVASGRVDAFVEQGATYAWDTAAGALMIREAGGTVTGWDGGDLNLGEGFSDVVATCGPIHEGLLAVV